MIRVLDSLQTPKSKELLQSTILSQRRRHLPQLSVHQEMHLRATARKEAFQIIRANSPEQRSSLVYGTNSRSSASGSLFRPSSLSISSGRVSNSRYGSRPPSEASYKLQRLASDSLKSQSNSMSYDLQEAGNTGMRNSFSAPVMIPPPISIEIDRSNSMPYLKD